ncbi:BMP family lipoprotein [Streptococcus pyogenes]|uniref:BMP family lipoprotein n=1 Tax=Streptococcus pyogenes TaxID=1314 RepID=UPI0010A10CDF|nr:BMP family protein [Streptococcus pyogenes]VHL61586.1 lipoprotein [Streptococcus pyogenes]
MNKKFIGLGLASVAVLSLAACGNRGASKGGASGKTDLKVAMVTDTGGVDDKSFNQSAWEGLQSWGKEMGLQKGTGFDYFQSTSESEYATNLDTAVSGGYQLIYGIGFALKDAIAKAAGDNEGVKSVDDTIQVKVDYAGSFGDAAKGKTIAAAQYAAGADVIYQAAGGTGAGVFNEAKAINEKRSEADKVWVIGVDRDQKDEGKYTSKDGKEANFVLASSIKEVGKAVQLINKQVADKKFPGGKTTVYGLKDGGVEIATTNVSKEAVKAIKEAKAKIKSGDIKVPEK